MDLDVQPWCEIWLISEGACTMASASRLIRGTVRAVHLSSNGDHLELTKLNGDGVETLPAHYP